MRLRGGEKEMLESENRREEDIYGTTFTYDSSSYGSLTKKIGGQKMGRGKRKSHCGEEVGGGLGRCREAQGPHVYRNRI